MAENEALLLERNLLEVWNERDTVKRRAIMESIYLEDATFYEGGLASTGYESMNNRIGHTLNELPTNFVFHIIQPARVNHNIGRLCWGVGPVNGEAKITGIDIALFRNGRIEALYVFLDEGSL
jgi:hypothetical protein